MRKAFIHLTISLPAVKCAKNYSCRNRRKREEAINKRKAAIDGTKEKRNSSKVKRSNKYNSSETLY